MPDTRPGPPFAGVDRYFDEPEPHEDVRAAGLLGWAATARKEQRGALLRRHAAATDKAVAPATGSACADGACAVPASK